MTEIIESNDGKRICIRFRLSDEAWWAAAFNEEADEVKLFLAIRDTVLAKLVEQGIKPFINLSKSFDTREEFHDICFIRPNNWNQIKDSLLL